MHAKWWIGGIGLLALGIWAVVTFHPNRQLEKRFEDLVDAVEARNVSRLEGFLAPHYQDAWGNSDQEALALAESGLQFFLSLEVEPQNPVFGVSERDATITTVFVVDGHGHGVAELILARGQELEEPFVFTWERMSWKPWDWKLVSISHPELDRDMERARSSLDQIQQFR